MTQCKRMDPYEMECQIDALKAENMSLAQKLHEKEEQVKKERSFLFSLIDGIPAFIYLQSKDYSIKYANRVFFDLFGDYEGRPCYKVMNHRDTPCEECRTFWVFDAKMPQQCRTNGTQKGFCYSKGSVNLIDRFMEEIEDRDLSSKVMITNTGCFGICDKGPIVVIYPEGVWYGNITEDDVARIVEEHLEGGLVVEDLRI